MVMKSQTASYGAAANDSRRDQQFIERDPGSTTVKGTTISFTAGATIADSNNGFGVFAVGDKIEVRGSVANSRSYTATAVAAGSMTLTPPVVTTESAGAAIIVLRGEC